METGIERTRRDDTLAFKLAVVEQIEKGECTDKEAQRRYGIQGRSTVLMWLRKHGRLGWSLAASSAAMPLDKTPKPLTPGAADQGASGPSANDHANRRAEAVVRLVRERRQRQLRLGTRKLQYLLREPLERIGATLGRDALFDVLRNVTRPVLRRHAAWA